jgi:hypothetical protein
MEFVVHKLDEFNLIPWATLDPLECGKEWSFGRGGHGFDDRTFTISTYEATPEEGDVCHIWPLPDVLCAMLKIHGEASAEEALRNVRNALGV